MWQTGLSEALEGPRPKEGAHRLPASTTQKWNFFKILFVIILIRMD